MNPIMDKRDNNSQTIASACIGPAGAKKTTMEAKFAVEFLSSKSLPQAIPITTNTSRIKTTHAQIFVPRRRRIFPVCNSTNSTGGSEDNPQPTPSPVTPRDTVEIRFKRGSRKRNKQLRADRNSSVSRQPTMTKSPDPPKKWEDMSLAEKALELYMGEKGLLFWLNKFAYASIFIVIGGWILFRFVGPSLKLYQLDAPPLPPSSMLKGS